MHKLNNSYLFKFTLWNYIYEVHSNALFYSLSFDFILFEKPFYYFYLCFQ